VDIRDQPGSDLVLSNDCMRGPVKTFISRPAAETSRIRMDRPWSISLSSTLGSGQNDLLSGDRAKGISQYERPLARAPEAVYGNEGLGGENDRLVALLSKPAITGGKGRPEIRGEEK